MDGDRCFHQRLSDGHGRLLPLLRGRRVAVLANHTAVAPAAAFGAATAADAAGRIHLVDLLHGRGFDVTGIFSPEHGFRGTADAGQHVGSSVDAATGIPIRSLYDGNTKRPSAAAMRTFDILAVDMQDVGVRFYTYYISMLRMMEACADAGIPVVVLDRPNPHGEKIDGPLLEKRFESGVGALPIPVLHGLTMGEIARMAVGEGWTARCEVTVVRCRNYTHATEYVLARRAVAQPADAARRLPLSDALPLRRHGVERGARYGPSLRDLRPSGLRRGRLPLHAPVDARSPAAVVRGRRLPGRRLQRHAARRSARRGTRPRTARGGLPQPRHGRAFLQTDLRKTRRVSYVREMILAGASAEEIRARWHDDVAAFRTLRARYLLYE